MAAASVVAAATAAAAVIVVWKLMAWDPVDSMDDVVAAVVLAEVLARSTPDSANPRGRGGCSKALAASGRDKRATVVPTSRTAMEYPITTHVMLFVGLMGSILLRDTGSLASPLSPSSSSSFEGSSGVA